MDNNNLKKILGLSLTILGVALLIFACIAFMSSSGTMMGMDVSGAKKIAPTVLGLIFLAAGVSIVKTS
jgi:threonine/homoserine/homoserine lactone efflux protein